MDKVTLGVAAGLVLAFVVWGALDSDGMTTGTGEALAWITDNFGWLFVLMSAAFLVFAAYLALTRHGNIRLGADTHERSPGAADRRPRSREDSALS